MAMNFDNVKDYHDAAEQSLDNLDTTTKELARKIADTATGRYFYIDQGDPPTLGVTNGAVFLKLE